MIIYYIFMFIISLPSIRMKAPFGQSCYLVQWHISTFQEVCGTYKVLAKVDPSDSLLVED